MMKFLLGAAAALGMVGTASAADLAARPYTKAPPVAVAVYDWSGFYVGANGGWGSSHKCWHLVELGFGFPNAPEGCHDATGGVVGGQIGYRWQSGAFVFGLEAQGNWADLTGSNVSLFGGPLVLNRTRIDALGFFTGQVGYAVNNALFYVKGGAVVSRDKYNGIATATGIPFDEAKESRWGGLVGVGLEYGFTRNWSVGIEYAHGFMGNQNITLWNIVPPLNVVSRRNDIRQDIDVVTARINYRFGGPVVAKY